MTIPNFRGFILNYFNIFIVMGNKRYLDKVVDFLVKHPHDPKTISFNDYCIDTFGLTRDEVHYVFYKYRYLMGWDQYDRSLPYLKKI